MHAKGCNGRPGAEVPGAENFMELEPREFFEIFFFGIEIIETKEPAWDSLISYIRAMAIWWTFWWIFMDGDLQFLDFKQMVSDSGKSFCQQGSVKITLW